MTMSNPDVPTTEPRMSSGEALAEILATVRRVEAQQAAFLELAETVVTQVQELAAGGVGGLMASILGGGNGNSEHPSH